MSTKYEKYFTKKCGAIGCTESRVFTVHGHKGKRVLCAEHARDYVGEDSLQLTIEAKYGGETHVKK